MNERDFIYWLQGFLELSGASELNSDQVKIIKDHIDLVMVKKTPDHGFSKPFLQPSLAPKCQGGIGTCSNLICPICNIPTIVTC